MEPVAWKPGGRLVKTMNRMAVVAAILNPLVSASDNLRPHFISPYRLLGHEFGPAGPQTPEE